MLRVVPNAICKPFFWFRNVYINKIKSIFLDVLFSRKDKKYVIIFFYKLG